MTKTLELAGTEVPLPDATLKTLDLLGDVSGSQIHISGRRRRAAAASPPPAKFPEELIRRHIERIVLKNAADDDHGMRPHDVDDGIASELSQVISADDRVVMTEPDVVYARLELNHVIDMRSTFDGPVHAATDAAERKPSVGVAAGELLEYVDHSILVETAVGKVHFGVGPELELAAVLRRRGIDARGNQASQMILVLLRVEDVNGLVPTFQSVLNERKQHAIFLFIAVEKRADMTGFNEL